jgi:hypothetical protein
MGTATFQAYFENTLIGRKYDHLSVLLNLLKSFLALSATDLVLLPEAQVTSHLTGRLIPQSGEGLTVVGQLFSEYLAADNITLSVKGESVQPTGASSPVTWLSDAFQTLTLNVNLPGQKFDVSSEPERSFSRILTTALDHPIYCFVRPQSIDGDPGRGVCSVVGF